MSRDVRDLYLHWINELWNGRAAAIDLVADTFVGHWPDRDVRGPHELQAIIDETRAMLDGPHFAVDIGPLCDGDLVAGRWRGIGRMSGGPAEFVGNDILRIAEGKAVEYWGVSAPTE